MAVVSGLSHLSRPSTDSDPVTTIARREQEPSNDGRLMWQSKTGCCVFMHVIRNLPAWPDFVRPSLIIRPWPPESPRRLVGCREIVTPEFGGSDMQFCDPTPDRAAFPGRLLLHL
jgi:hypothetical protein